MSNFVKTQNNPHKPMQAAKILLMLLLDQSFMISLIEAYAFAHIVFVVMSIETLLPWVKLVTILITFFITAGHGALKFYRYWTKGEIEEEN